MKFLLKILFVILCSVQILNAQTDEFSQKDLDEIQIFLFKNREVYWADFEKYRDTSNDIYAFKKDWSAQLIPLQDEIVIEKDSEKRRILLFKYLQLVTLNAESFDTNLVKTALKEIPVNSKLWSLKAVPEITKLIYSINSSEFIGQYAEHAGANTQDGVPQVLYNIGRQADIHKDSLKVLQIIGRLEKEFPESKQAAWAKTDLNFSPFKKIKIGNKIPQFAFKNADNSEEIFTDEKLRGKYYLIDFWGTWCKPCLSEMPHLYEAFKGFKDRNFTILSISMEDTKDFRAGKWAMPWQNVVLKDGKQDVNLQTFEVVYFPTTILVNPDGIIVATEMELRGRELEKTLARFIKN